MKPKRKGGRGPDRTKRKKGTGRVKGSPKAKGSGLKCPFPDPVKVTTGFTVDRSQAEALRKSLHRVAASYRIEWLKSQLTGNQTLTEAVVADTIRDLEVGMG